MHNNFQSGTVNKDPKSHILKIRVIKSNNYVNNFKKIPCN